MGQLKPGATYIYERVGGTVYAREFGANPEDRFVIGHDYVKDSYLDNFAIEYELESIWKDLLKECKTNKSLQEAVERVKIQYYLSKKDGQE